MSLLQHDRNFRRKSSPSGPPYAPQIAGLGGKPTVNPDVPITAVFLALYVIFAIVHMRIMRAGQKRGHKFVFSGAMFGFCKIRVITMSLRLAWACHNNDISLGIAATVFVYVGTVILYIVNWFFAQRIVRAQHPNSGWSTTYRLIHRSGVVLLLFCLVLLIVASIQQFFTLNVDVLRIDRNFQLTGITYFAAFCFAPIVLVAVSLFIPRNEVDKFGAGRLRNNIAILLIATTILSIGQIFRCVVAWLPPTRLVSPSGRPVEIPWYLSRFCFYFLNFLTELIVVIFYAVTRVDLRFHVPDGAKEGGSYSKGRTPSSYNINVIGKEVNLRRMVSLPLARLRCANLSNETIEEFDGPLFDDTRTLADSLRYPSSVLEVDPTTGHYKVRRTSSMHSGQVSHAGSEPSLWSPDRDTVIVEEVPPLPPLPADWPLRTGRPATQGSLQSTSQGRHRDRVSSQSLSNIIERGDAIAEAVARLEGRSELHKKRRQTSSRSSLSNHEFVDSIRNRSQGDLPMKRVHSPITDSLRKQAISREISTTTSSLPKKYNYVTRSDSPLKQAQSSTSESQVSASPRPGVAVGNTTAPPATPTTGLTGKRSIPRGTVMRETQSNTSNDETSANGEFARFSSDCSRT
ncbi:hypothetical protein BU24DRAFT_492246 [Aaosphaeria arxii CBS 175.79]|uniref:DUF3112 domain-containing protein n=1 Tax=Aaosphaeria arxii CBS 175.79 TaxID=1450172 RepID=A0A6A5XT32_9PLEO|nr:uncharacterized protein BU24DRAFT_492246 [Aaosphaeria arxii CBS 175.79]KAF2016086.1 hypothetical protein BU24DRAFT_492246 [Aaosphaeria arxii CBS 175.79]